MQAVRGVNAWDGEERWDGSGMFTEWSCLQLGVFG